jgi:hypothetical protein
MRQSNSYINHNQRYESLKSKSKKPQYIIRFLANMATTSEQATGEEQEVGEAEAKKKGHFLNISSSECSLYIPCSSQKELSCYSAPLLGRKAEGEKQKVKNKEQGAKKFLLHNSCFCLQLKGFQPSNPRIKNERLNILGIDKCVECQ